MPYDEALAVRLERLYSGREGFRETRMFGGFGYLQNGNMCVGLHKDRLILRVGEENAQILMSEPHVVPMDITGRVMKAWAMIEPEGLESDDALARYCGFADRFVAGLPAKK